MAAPNKGTRIPVTTKKVYGHPPKDYTDEQVHELGQEMVDWLQERLNSGNPAFHLSEWYIMKKGILYTAWDALRKRKDFLQYYQAAMELMALSVLSNAKMQTAYGSRFLGIYSKDVRDHEKTIKEETAEIERAAKSKEVINITAEEMEYNRSIISGLVALQNRNNQGQEPQ